MSSTQDSEKVRVYMEKSLEGARLFAVGDYEGAIAACNEAIELEPGGIGAIRTRWEARERLGMAQDPSDAQARAPDRRGEMDVAPCPKCSGSGAVPVSFTWWGGWLGPGMFNVVKCVSCDTQYNAKTGRLNTTAIIIYSVVGGSIAVAFIIARLFI